MSKDIGRYSLQMTEYDYVFFFAVLSVPKVNPAVTWGHKLGSTCWWSLCMVCRARGVS